ncbi:F-box/kelch-repeat protein SKIP25-like isoform X2 [Olea europaea var. sylvestris]|uniref:F-box/kelch-repeat protein SKIP25-like isoform X2 n=1 Tax=Olea europaea var. sylvestris TaxID=158386 RepID=UPI000C1CE75E|nr:F-box/kelch-repeat protein SKIP25-like isoform X2 [Olea europaea var. sylvestris]
MFYLQVCPIRLLSFVISLSTLLFSTEFAVQDFNCFDPISSTWRMLPSPPIEALRFDFRHHPQRSPSIQSSICLIVFDPISRNWSFGPLLSNPRPGASLVLHMVQYILQVALVCSTMAM